MAVEITYVGGTKDGKIRRTRSTCDLPTIERTVWREFDKTTGNPTGREQHENYKLDHKRREYVLQGGIESGAVN